MRALFLAVVLTGAGAGVATAQVNCWEAGSHILCSNGQTFTRSGSSVIDSRGNIWQEYGDKSGRRIYDPGSGSQQTGNITSGPSGQSCVRFGNQIFCSPGGK